MTEYPFTAEDLEALKAWDTPTICNGLEIVAPERRAIGFTVEPMVVRRPQTAADRRPRADGHDPRQGAAARTDPPARGLVRLCGGRRSSDHRRDPGRRRSPGFGAFWGEVHTAVHAALGVAGCVTNGSFRDIDMLAPGFQIVGGRIGPSHAHVHMVQMKCDVNIFGMLRRATTTSIHADLHGAVVIPAEAVRALPKAIDLMSRREKVILDRARSPGFTSRAMRDALRQSGEIH